MVSDAAIALHLLWAAMVTARYNVWINLKSIDDGTFTSSLKNEMRSMLHDGKKLRRRLTKQVRSVIEV